MVEAMNSIYTRLPGARRTPVSKDTLWMANDHLLVVHSNRISEEYQRIYFKDIQALIVEESEQSGKTAVLGGIVAVLILVVAALFLSRHYILAVLLLLPIAIPFSIWLSLAECRCHAVTAIGRYRLGALKRRDSLQHALAILTPIVLEAQKKEAAVAGASTSEVL
jgi:hypothetical protein